VRHRCRRIDVVEELYPLARKRSVAVEHPHADEVLVALDAEKMTRVVRAILDNAIRYASDGGNVGVRIQWSEREATLEIRDDRGARRRKPRARQCYAQAARSFG